MEHGNRITDREVNSPRWDHSSHERFYNYYAGESLSEAGLQRLATIRDLVLRVAGTRKLLPRTLEVAEIGCGAGAMCMLWAELGHNAHGLDINEPLLQLGRRRAALIGYRIDFRLGSSTELPWPDRSMDVCLAVELLEHVADWERTLHECERILRPGGILYLATSNKLCPMQNEFNLPLYSWYPGRLKRHFERLAATTRPDLANFARYPAVNWFTPYGLRGFLTAKGFACLDRFDLADTSNRGVLARLLLTSVRRIPTFRWLAYLTTIPTIIVATKTGRVA